MSEGTATKSVGSTPESTAVTPKGENSGLRKLLITFDLTLLIVVVLGTTGTLNSILDLLGLPTVPFPVTVEWYVYAFAVLGALGYVFTKLVKKPERDFTSLVHANIRLPASLPLAAGFYLLSGQFLGSEPPADLMAGIAFLTGLFVNIAYKRIGALAKRMLPADERDDETADSASAAGGRAAAAAAGSDERGGDASTDGQPAGGQPAGGQQDGDATTSGGHADADSLADDLVGSGSSGDSA